MASISAKIREQSERIEKARAEFNYRSIEALIRPGSSILDVGAWACYLGQMLRDRRACEVLSLDVIDANQTDMPFRVFDGQTFPVETRSVDTVLLLYVLHHAADSERLLHESCRVLREDGQLLVAEDCVDGIWNRILTLGFHVWLRLVTKMGWDGEFGTIPQWRTRFRKAGFEVRETIPLGHHLGHRLWPNNVLFVVEKQARARTATSS